MKRIMMSKTEEVKIAKQMGCPGCRFFVMNSNGGVMGGFYTVAAAIEFKAKCEREYANDPWNSNLKFRIEAR